MEGLLNSIRTITTEELIDILRERCRETSQRDVARQLHLSETMVSDLLNGKRLMSKRTAYLLGFKPELRWRPRT